jgi:dTDP-4-dehydrorhamnose 3,5-epimerase-like enzyme
MDVESTQQSSYFIIEFNELADDRGSLVALEGNTHIPFDIKRVFYIYNSDDSVIRGCHANRNSKFVLIALRGSVKITLCTPQKRRDVIVLSHPHTGLYLDKMVWKEMSNFSKDCILLVLSSELYDKEEYVYEKEFFES